MPGIGTLVGAGIGAIAGGMQSSAAKKAKKANEARYRQMLALLAAQGQATKDDIRAGAVQERAGQVQTAAGRGLYNTSVLDTLQSQSNDREARALAGVDQQTAAGQVAVMNDRTDAYPDPGPSNAALAGLGAMVPGIVAGLGKSNAGGPTQTGNQWGKAVGDAVGGVTKATAKASPYANMLGLGTANNVATAASAAAAPIARTAGKAAGWWAGLGKKRNPYAAAL